MSAPPPLSADEAAARARSAVAAARDAQSAWAALDARARCRTLGRLRGLLARDGAELAELVPAPARAPGDTLAAEILPLADAVRWLERRAPGVLAERAARGPGSSLLPARRPRVLREPMGVVLVVGPSNYPLFLPAVQAVQALAAGNAAVLKPGRGGGPALVRLAGLLAEAVLDPRLVPVLDESDEAARAALDAGCDMVVLTGSSSTGRAVLADAARRLVPAIVELSGCDAVFVREDADVELAARALRFALRLNGGATCIAPRRVLCHRALMPRLGARLAELLRGADALPLPPGMEERARELLGDALARGAKVLAGGAPEDAHMPPTVLALSDADCALFHADVFAPLLGLVAVEGDDHALAVAARGEHALGATIFGAPSTARSLAARVPAGVVVVNDAIVPTADPRAPFGGRGASGFGATRGAEGLLALTRPKVVLEGPAFKPHLDPRAGNAGALVEASLRAEHAAGMLARLRGALDRLRAAVALARHSRGARRPERSRS